MADGPEITPGRTRREPYTRVIIPNLSDEELLSHAFLIENPHLLPNLTDEEPPRDQELTLIGRYKLGAKVRCVFGHPHKEGFAFKSTDERHFLVGNICGQHVMGVEAWQAFDREQGGVEDRARYLKRIRALQDALRPRRDWIAQLRTSEPIQSMASLRNMLGLRRDLAEAIRTAFKFHDGRIDRLARTRNIQAEIQREEREQDEIDRFEALSQVARDQYLLERSAPTLTRGDIFMEHRVEIGQLAGRPLFMDNFGNATQMRSIIDQIDALLAFDTMTEQNSHLKRVAMQSRTILDKILSIQDEIADAIAFFSQSNLEALALWANDRAYDNATYAVGPASLFIHDERTGRDIRIIRPAHLQPLDPEGFAELQAAANAYKERN